MKEFFDQLRAEAEQHELPQPAELRARGDRRAARRGAAGAFSLAVVIAGGFIAARPLFHETPPSIADGPVTSSPMTISAETRPVPNVVGMSRGEAISALTQEGFMVQVKAATPPPSQGPQAGKVRQQDPVAALRIPSHTMVTIWVDQLQETEPACADKYPKRISTTLFTYSQTEICFAPATSQTSSESLPVPCSSTVFDSETLIEDRRGFRGTTTEQISSGPASTMADQVITKYTGPGAKNYMSELSKEVGHCDPVTRGRTQLTYSFVPGQQETIGEQSLLLNVEYHLMEKPESGPQASSYLVSVVLVGVYVIVVYDKGWEGVPSKRATIIGLAKEIAGRIISSPSPGR